MFAMCQDIRNVECSLRCKAVEKKEQEVGLGRVLLSTSGCPSRQLSPAQQAASSGVQAAQGGALAWEEMVGSRVTPCLVNGWRLL